MLLSVAPHEVIAVLLALYLLAILMILTYVAVHLACAPYRRTSRGK